MFEQTTRKTKPSNRTRLNIKKKNNSDHDECNISSDEDIPEEYSPIKIHSSDKTHMRKVSQQIFMPSKY